jgi:hypothetical protein
LAKTAHTGDDQVTEYLFPPVSHEPRIQELSSPSDDSLPLDAERTAAFLQDNVSISLSFGESAVVLLVSLKDCEWV